MLAAVRSQRRIQGQIDDDEPYQILVVSQLVLLELAVCTLAGSPGQAADCQQACIAVECVEKGVGVAFAEGELHDAGTEHGVSRVSRIATVLVGRIQDLDQCAGAGDNPLDNGCEEAVAAFRGLFRLFDAIKIEIAHDDLAGLRGQAAAWRCERWAVNFFVRF